MSKRKQKVSLVGIGMGTRDMLTAEAIQVIRESDCIIGAKRMLEAVGAGEVHIGLPEKTGENHIFLPGEKKICQAYLPEEIREIAVSHPEYQNIAVLYSGDTGFYSGAKEMYRMLEDVCEVRGIPGISSVACFASRLGISWEDVRLVSIHGRSKPYIHILARHKKCFLLFGGRGQEEEFCGKLKEYRLTGLRIWIGRALSYEEERILYRTGETLQPEDLKGLVILYIENPLPFPKGSAQLRDDAFIRGNVPMTKEEVRAVSIAKLMLTEDSVLYDVGAGTGSVAVTVASMYETARVYAIEKNAEGAELIRKNQRKFCVDQLHIIEGTAPEALDDLEPPTHVFIGGSSGNLEEILHCVRKKNPDAKVVLNVVTLETLSEVLKAEEKGLLKGTEITQINVAKSRRIADYHMMTGQNPVYIISESGREV